MAGYIGSKASVVSSGAERKKTFTITGATTSLTGLNYTVGKVHVFQNGVRLVDGTDYTATNGTTITLTVAAQNGDNVVVISQAAFQVADALLTSGGTMTGDLTVQGAFTSPGIDDNADAVALTIDSSENVGIGTNSPTTRLSFGNYIPSNGQTIHTYQNGNTVSGLGIVAGVHRMFTNTGASLSYGHVSSSDGSTYTEDMRIDASGNVGIGTSSIVDSAWYTASGANTELALDGNSGYGIMHFRGTGAGSTDTKYTQGVGDSKFYMAYDSVAQLHRMTIEPSGAITTPTQPAFVATTSGSTDITTQTIIPYDNNLYDRATSFNAANYRFTAPVTGLYTFTTYHWHKNNTGGRAHLYLYLNGSVNFEYRNTRASSHNEYNRVGFTTTLAMSANDYVYVAGEGTGGGELHTSSGAAYSHFSGYLIG
jgi:hypothetical protein